MCVQLVECTSGEFVVYTRWGRTGTSGCCKKEDFDDAEAACVSFAKTFQSKAGVPWTDETREAYVPKCVTSSYPVFAFQAVIGMFTYTLILRNAFPFPCS